MPLTEWDRHRETGAGKGREEMAEGDGQGQATGGTEGQGSGAGGQGGTPGQAGGQQQSGAGGTPVTFDGWLGGLPDEQKSLVNGHIAGLKSALESEREQRRSFESQLREAAKKAEKGSEMEQRLSALADKAGQAERQAKFYEVASAAGATNLKLAWIAAQEAKLIDGQGNVSTEALKAQFPELFKAPPCPQGQCRCRGRADGTTQQAGYERLHPAAGRLHHLTSRQVAGVPTR